MSQRFYPCLYLEFHLHDSIPDKSHLRIFINKTKCRFHLVYIYVCSSKSFFDRLLKSLFWCPKFGRVKVPTRFVLRFVYRLEGHHLLIFVDYECWTFSFKIFHSIKNKIHVIRIRFWFVHVLAYLHNFTILINLIRNILLFHEIDYN